MQISYNITNFITTKLQVLLNVSLRMFDVAFELRFNYIKATIKFASSFAKDIFLIITSSAKYELKKKKKEKSLSLVSVTLSF